MQRMMSSPACGATPLQCGASFSDTAPWSSSSSRLPSQDSRNRTVPNALSSAVGSSLPAASMPLQGGSCGFAGSASASLPSGQTLSSDSRSAQVGSPMAAGVRLSSPLRRTSMAGPPLQLKALVRHQSPRRGDHSCERMIGPKSSATCLNHGTGSIALEADSAAKQKTWTATHLAATHAVCPAQASLTPNDLNQKPESKLVALEAKSSAAVCSLTASASMSSQQTPLQSQLDSFSSSSTINPEQAMHINLNCSSMEGRRTMGSTRCPEFGTDTPHFSPASPVTQSRMSSIAANSSMASPSVTGQFFPSLSDTALQVEQDHPVAMHCDRRDVQTKQTFYGQFAAARIPAERNEGDGLTSDLNQPQDDSLLAKALGSPRHSDISTAVDSTTTPKSSSVESSSAFYPLTRTKDGQDPLEKLDAIFLSITDNLAGGLTDETCGLDCDALRKQIHRLRHLFDPRKGTPGPTELGRELEESQKQLRELEESRKQLQGLTNPENSFCPERQMRSSHGSQEYENERLNPGLGFSPLISQKAAETAKCIERAPRVNCDAQASRRLPPQPESLPPTNQPDGLTLRPKLQSWNRDSDHLAEGAQVGHSMRVPTASQSSTLGPMRLGTTTGGTRPIRQSSPLRAGLMNPSARPHPVSHHHVAPNEEARPSSMRPSSPYKRSSSSYSTKSSQSSHHHSFPNEESHSRDLQKTARALQDNKRVHDRLEKLLGEIENCEQSPSVLSVIHEIRVQQREMMA